MKQQQELPAAVRICCAFCVKFWTQHCWYITVLNGDTSLSSIPVNQPIWNNSKNCCDTLYHLFNNSQKYYTLGANCYLWWNTIQQQLQEEGKQQSTATNIVHTSTTESLEGTQQQQSTVNIHTMKQQQGWTVSYKKESKRVHRIECTQHFFETKTSNNSNIIPEGTHQLVTRR